MRQAPRITSTSLRLIRRRQAYLQYLIRTESDRLNLSKPLSFLKLTYNTYYVRQCKTCGKKYESIGKHWRWNPDHRPSFTNTQKQILRGLLMGDGTLHKKDDPNPYILTAMTKKPYLKYLEDKFGVLGKDVRLKQTAEESAEAMRNNGLRPNAKAGDYSAVYKWATRSHPELNCFKKWYTDGNKKFPRSFKLTPLTLKHWFVGDGHLQQVGGFYRASIALTNQRDNRSTINNLFEDAGLPAPKWSERNSGNKRTEIIWKKKGSEKILDYMGDPLPGFNYKWPE